MTNCIERQNVSVRIQNSIKSLFLQVRKLRPQSDFVTYQTSTEEEQSVGPG